MPIAELFLSTVVKALSKQLGSSILEEYARIHGISEKLKNWQGALQLIHAVVESAEERQVHSNPAVDLWLAKLREVAYDMEDLLDVFEVDAREEAWKANTRLAKLASYLIACCSKMNPCTLLSDHHMATEIEEIDKRLDEIFRLKEGLGLAENSKAKPSATSSQPHFPTSSLRERKFFGRKKEMEKLLVQLTGSDATDDCAPPYDVVSIVGMGGLGKTTLAQELYNHESVRATFEPRAWVCVSEVFDKDAITKHILQGIAPSIDSEKKDLNWLQNKLTEQLSGKKFLIVLDDVWKENNEELQYLLKPFHSGRRGSRILLTTRNRRVAELVGVHDPTDLGLLSSEDCLSLLAYDAIGKESFDSQPRLRDIAAQLALKCKGLPLATKTIGGLLRFESSAEKWKDVLEHDVWKKEGEHNRIPLALELSYIHLPIPLKRCFAACALFPKDYLFDRDELIHLWTVQGLLQKGTAKTYMDVGMDYFRQLQARSLFQKAGPLYSMHDLISDLAKSVFGVTYYISDEYRGPPNEESNGKVRHAAFLTRNYERCLASKVDVCRSMKNLRAFLSFQVSPLPYPNVSVSNKVIHDLIVGLKYLRVLSLRYFSIGKVPDQIGELKLLRSIDFSYTYVELLPESICGLVNLESLLLRQCRKLEKLPTNIHKLTKLLHLDIVGVTSLEEMPPHIGDLTNLEILSSLVVGKGAGQGLKELEPLKGLQRELHICDLVEVDNVGDARAANLWEKEGISYFCFHWGFNRDGISRDDEHQLKLLDHLRPPTKIEHLRINGFGGKKFPSWFGRACMNDVVSITLKNCKSVESLPPFGELPSLERLSIGGFHALSEIGAEFYGTQNPFRTLRSLSFLDMPAWEKWSPRGDYENEQKFPRLEELTMLICPVLKRGLPGGRLESLSELVIRDCPLLETTGDSLSLPSLRKMEFQSSNEGLLKCLVDVTSMTKMTISNVSQLVHFDGRFSTSWVSLEEIQIFSCRPFKSFMVEQLPPKLKILHISDCENLEKLPDDLYRLPSLNELRVSNCQNLSSFPSSGLPPTLSKLSLHNLEGFTSVTDLIAGDCCSQSLGELNISGCRTLTTLQDCLRHLSSLSRLRVSNCPELELDCFPALPCSLSTFQLDSCPKVKSLPNNMQHLTSLKDLEIVNCDSITSFPTLPCNLSRFTLRRCPKVKSLPHDMQNLKDLECLGIVNCRKLNQPLEEWGLSGLAALRELLIEGGMECVDEMVCFPSADDGNAWGCGLPSSLVELNIRGMNKVERLAGGLRTQLPFLKVLQILDCPRMRYLPKDEGLPHSLEAICVQGCDLLEERCSEPKGEYWPLLELIPSVIVGE